MDHADPRHSARVGLGFALAAYIMWGFFPLFWLTLRDVDPLEVVCHRILWSTVVLPLAILALRFSRTAVGRELAGSGHEWAGSGREWASGWTRSTAPDRQLGADRQLGDDWQPGADRQREAGQSPARRQNGRRNPRLSGRLWLISLAAALVISANWLAFVWAVAAGRILDASLGYYISPLVSVALGVTVLRERLSRLQWAAILTATVGVTWIAWQHGQVPYAALVMAATFAVYGLLKKFSPMPSLVGLLMENCLLVLPAFAYLYAFGSAVTLAPPSGPLRLWALLFAGGAITVPPLMCFAIAARRVPLATIGILQFIAPTLQLLVGVGFAGESLLDGRLIGFACVWVGCLAYAWSLLPPSGR